MPVHLTSDLAFALAAGGRSGVHGRLRETATGLELEVADAGAFAGAGDAPAIASLAEALAELGVVIRVVSGGEHLVSLGAVVAPRWQRRLTGSRRIRLESPRGTWAAACARARG